MNNEKWSKPAFIDLSARLQELVIRVQNLYVGKKINAANKILDSYLRKLNEESK